ncbi:PH domain-containing protein [Dermacoccaceae bacterium W4C1]
MSIGSGRQTHGSQVLSVARPATWLKILGFVILVVMIGALALAVADDSSGIWAWVVMVPIALIVSAAGLHLALTPVRLSADENGLTAQYWPMTRRLGWEQIEQVQDGDRGQGIGCGFGYRWEGRGRIAIRLGGPMVTITHTDGRLALSVTDADAVVAALARTPAAQAFRG